MKVSAIYEQKLTSAALPVSVPVIKKTVGGRNQFCTLQRRAGTALSGLMLYTHTPRPSPEGQMSVVSTDSLHSGGLVLSHIYTTYLHYISTSPAPEQRSLILELATNLMIFESVSQFKIYLQ